MCTQPRGNEERDWSNGAEANRGCEESRRDEDEKTGRGPGQVAEGGRRQPEQRVGEDRSPHLPYRVLVATQVEIVKPKTNDPWGLCERTQGTAKILDEWNEHWMVIGWVCGR